MTRVNVLQVPYLLLIVTIMLMMTSVKAKKIYTIPNGTFTLDSLDKTCLSGHFSDFLKTFKRNDQTFKIKFRKFMSNIFSLPFTEPPKLTINEDFCGIFQLWLRWVKGLFSTLDCGNKGGSNPIVNNWCSPPADAGSYTGPLFRCSPIACQANKGKYCWYYKDNASKTTTKPAPKPKRGSKEDDKSPKPPKPAPGASKDEPAKGAPPPPKPKGPDRAPPDSLVGQCSNESLCLLDCFKINHNDEPHTPTDYKNALNSVWSMYISSSVLSDFDDLAAYIVSAESVNVTSSPTPFRPKHSKDDDDDDVDSIFDSFNHTTCQPDTYGNDTADSNGDNNNIGSGDADEYGNGNGNGNGNGYGNGLGNGVWNKAAVWKCGYWNWTGIPATPHPRTPPPKTPKTRLFSLHSSSNEKITRGKRIVQTLVQLLRKKFNLRDNVTTDAPTDAPNTAVTPTNATVTAWNPVVNIPTCSTRPCSLCNKRNIGFPCFDSDDPEPAASCCFCIPNVV